MTTAVWISWCNYVEDDGITGDGKGCHHRVLIGEVMRDSCVGAMSCAGPVAAQLC